MQYWLYAFKYGEGTTLIDKYDTLQDAKIGRDKLDPNEYEYADIIRMEWEQEPRCVSSVNFEYEKGKTIVKRRKYDGKRDV